MKILRTSINSIKQYIGKECTLVYDGNIAKVQVGRVTLELYDIQSIGNKRPENWISIFTDSGNIEIDNN